MTIKSDTELIEEIAKYVKENRRVSVFDLIQYFNQWYDVMHIVEQMEKAEDLRKIRGSYFKSKKKFYANR